MAAVPPPPPPPPPPATPRVVYQSTILQRPGLGTLMLDKRCQSLRCPFCGAQVLTSTSCHPSTAGWIFAFVLLLVFCPVAFIPLLVSQDIDHRCPSCGMMVGRYYDPTCR